MLRFLGSPHRFCDGATRRDFLQIGAFGAGVTLADMLHARSASAAAGKKQASRSNKAAIMIYLPGGPSHIDMYDPKPDAPVEFRGEFNPIKTNVAGVEICEHFPLQAKMWDKLACVRSVVSVDEHSDSLVMTGYPDRVNRTADHPCFGSVVSKVRAESNGAVPPFVSLRGMSRGTEPGYLGIAHRPFTPGGQGNANLRLAQGVTAGRLDDRKGLLTGFDDTRREIDASGTMVGMDSYTEKAIEMVTAGVVRDALDIRKEDPKTQERYKGVEQFLTARRLVEAGVGCVTLSIGGWDTHGQNFQTLKKQLPKVDQGIANLIQDLHDRGMADDVVTVMWGEFGRTPKVNMNAGRDHWSPVMGAMIAGGGLKMGQAIGASTAKGERPKDRPITVPQLLGTIYRQLGIDPGMTFPNGGGRPMYVLDDREPVKELLG
ncbi:hypothetical protein : Putative uncharacterized protein OS=uncultured Acidobacteria bacterium A2 PE=4 SV=1: DUF1501 [Gemmataceae bacterium]|nr:hypothetical protein : Putative uncharacterized protein OS=uncultured Acidobacteria bacterium A2 PE=4 SV=1: DUF1501 [Gemmataceae bacterium]VTT98306.1 hypothetical protein : Putative uncharacterized protein OS=uncultured Acidobacteria bacterium A2 PE=4 SV=1: DUF1501 [Gemmataceae bacterium]